MKNMYIIINIFSTLIKSDMVLRSDFKFPFVTSTPFSMCFAVDFETTHSKIMLSFFCTFKGSFFLINVAHTKTLVSSSLMDEIE